MSPTERARIALADAFEGCAAVDRWPESRAFADVRAAISKAVADEREACAALAESVACGGSPACAHQSCRAGRNVAAAIRARRDQ